MAKYFWIIFEWLHCSIHITLSLVLLFNIFILVLDEDVEMNIKVLYNSFIIFNDRKKGRTINEADGRIKIQKDLKPKKMEFNQGNCKSVFTFRR